MLVMVESPAERLAVVLRQVRDKTMTQIDLAATVGESQSWVSRRESGEVEPTPSEVARIEQALRIPAGTVFLLAGLVDGDVSARAAIATDPLLTQDARDILLGAYDAVIEGIRRRGESTGDDIAEHS